MNQVLADVAVLRLYSYSEPCSWLRAALGDQHHLAARGSPLIDALAAHRDAEFLHRIERNGQHRVESGIDVCAIPIYALIRCAGGGVLRHQAGVLVVVDIHAI